MTAATALRATALPMPVVITTEDYRTVGRVECRRMVAALTIGDTALLLGSTGTVYRECGRCTAGTGTLACFGHVYGGICFECNGAGVRQYGETIEAAQRKVRSAQAKAARAAAAAQAAADAYAAALPAIVEAAHIAALAEQDQREAAARDAQAAADAQRYLGETGAKITFTGKVVVTYTCESVYGTRYLVVIEGQGDDAGATVKTIGTSEFHYAAERGEVVTIKATVKDHEEYRGTKQTVVIRPKAL